MHFVVPGADQVLVPAVIRRKVAVHDRPEARVVFGLPLHAEPADRIGAEFRHHRRRAPRAHQERVSRDVRGRLENVARSGQQRAAESRIEVALLHELPGEDLLHVVAALGVNAVRHREHQLVGVGEQVALVEADEPIEVLADPGDVPVHRARLDHVLQLVAEHRLLVEDPRQRREIRNRPKNRARCAPDSCPRHDSSRRPRSCASPYAVSTIPMLGTM